LWFGVSDAAPIFLIFAGMVVIGLIGWLLDMLMRQVERFKALRWAYGIRHD
jgi:NitT/TauT family transport system permease protein